MKIQLQNVLYYPSTGGIESYIQYISKKLIKLNHQPMILSSMHKKELTKYDSYDNINIIRHPYYKINIFPVNILSPIYFVKRLEYFLRKNKFDIDLIWSNFFLNAFSSCKAFRGKLPIIFINHAISSNLIKLYVEYANTSVFVRFYVRSLQPQYFLIEKQAVEECSKVVTLSKMRKREVHYLYGIDKNKINVVPPGVDIHRFSPGNKELSLLDEFGIPLDSKIILTVGRLSHEKNFEMLINAFNKIKDENIFLIIVGDGTERRYLKEYVKKLNLTKKVIFTGVRTDIERFYRIADLFVLPSKYEGFGLVYLEAMSSGVPCIGLKSDFPNVIVASEEIIDDGNTGFLADPYSIEDLAEKISKIIYDKKLRSKFGEKSRKVCEENYSWENTVNSLLKISKEIS
jgi:glycosyltransferase involved in cell wall biosynthesis